MTVAALITWLITALGGFYLLGITMFFRWIGVYRSTPAAVPAASSTDVVPAERHLPVPVVLAHGALAATTLVLVLLAAIGV
jgi:hypothetical protein